MKEDRALVFLHGADQMIEKAITVVEAKDISAAARAVEVWARRAKKGPELVAKAVRYQLRAEARMGEILRGMKERGERAKQGGDRAKSPNGILLKDLGVTPKESSRAQQLAALPIERRERAIQIAEKNLSVGAALKFAREEHRAEKIEAIRKRASRTRGAGRLEVLDQGFGDYRCVLVDPPWAHDDETCRGAAAHHYPTLTPEKLAQLRVEKLLHPEGGHAWIWTTWPKIRDRHIHVVLDAWDLRWVGEIVWNKRSMGTGRWIRGQTEVLVLAVRGNLPLLARDQAGWFDAKRGRHSEKPEKAYALIERLSPGPRIELFARGERKGWDRWGLEA